MACRKSQDWQAAKSSRWSEVPQRTTTFCVNRVLWNPFLQSDLWASAVSICNATGLGVQGVGRASWFWRWRRWTEILDHQESLKLLKTNQMQERGKEREIQGFSMSVSGWGGIAFPMTFAFCLTHNVVSVFPSSCVCRSRHDVMISFCFLLSFGMATVMFLSTRCWCFAVCRSLWGWSMWIDVVEKECKFWRPIGPIA